ncbi:tetratricopeptide repeat protein [Micromonospora zhanjiangensis]
MLSLADLAEELAEAQRPLDQLEIRDDPQASCRSVFSWSYGHLPIELQRAFRLLGLSPGAQHDAWDLAALADLERVVAGGTLWALARASLLQERQPRRFEMHVLLRMYGRELAEQEDSAQDRVTSVQRLADHYAASSAAAAVAIFGERVRANIGAVPDREVPPFPDRPAALAWMAAEHSNVVAACHRADAFELGERVLRLSETMNRYLSSQGLWPSIRIVHEAALATAGNPTDRADVLHRLAVMHMNLGENARALELSDEVIATRRVAGDLRGEAAALGNRGLSLDRLGRYREALDHHRKALELALRSDHRSSIADGLGNIGNTLDALGLHQEALTSLRDALTRYTDAGDEHGRARTLNNMGVISYRLADWEGALHHFRSSLALKQALGDRTNEGSSRGNVGLCLARLGRYEAALAELTKADEIAREAGDVNHRAMVLSNLSSVRAEMGDFAGAVAGHQEALAISEEANDRGVMAEISNDLGETLTKAGRPHDAIALLQRAEQLATESGDRFQLERAQRGLAKARLALEG